MEKNWLKSYPPGISHEIDLSQYKNLNEVIYKTCDRFTNNIAFTNMGVDLSFKDLNILTNKMTAFFQNELKLQKGDRIAIQMPNLLQYPVVLFAALRAGLIIVNTNPLYTAKEMKHQFKDSGAKAIVILANFAHLLETILPETQIEHVIVTEIGDLFPQPKAFVTNFVVKYIKKMVPSFHFKNSYSLNEALQIGSLSTPHKIDVEQTDIAFLQYTGGTTGVSKGAILQHRQILANMIQIREWMKIKFTEGEEACLTALPLYHIFSLSVNCFSFLAFGAKNILITNPRDIPGFIKIMKNEKFSLMTGVNTLFNALMNHPEFEKINFKNMKLSVAGAMALQSSVSEKWLRKTGSKIIEGYGLTEASPVVSVNPVDGTDIVGTIGMPLPSTDVRLVNDNEEEVGLNEPGELCCRGPQVMQGYWNQPSETAQSLKNGWLHTGDIATIDEKGFLRLVDRKKDMILVSGFNVYPNEVEDAIASHPSVLEVAAIGVPSESSGEVVKVFIVKKDPTVTAEDIIAYSKKSLTNYKIPKFVEFKDELPKTNVGKILRRSLREEELKKIKSL